MDKNEFGKWKNSYQKSKNFKAGAAKIWRNFGKNSPKFSDFFRISLKFSEIQKKFSKNHKKFNRESKKELNFRKFSKNHASKQKRAEKKLRACA